MKLDERPMDADKFLRKFAKHAIWIVVACLTAMTFVGYFTDIRALFTDFWLLNSSAWATGSVLFFTFATYGNAGGWMREVMCTHMCPLCSLPVGDVRQRHLHRGPTMKSAESLVARASVKLTPPSIGKGDCIDCNLCVQVCPTGIDIRNGLAV